MNDSSASIDPFLYLPIEVSAREPDAKLLIASFAVKRGFEVVIGQKWLLQRDLLGRLSRFSQQAGDAPQFKVQACGDRLFHIHGNAGEPDQLYQVPRESWPARLFRSVSIRP